MPSRSLFATFIGIDAYTQTPLNGCIMDVLDMDLFLREQAAQQDGMEYKPLYFLAPNTVDTLRIRDHKNVVKADRFDYEPATFDSITKKAFAHLKEAKAGDTCFFYYSGHGSQADAPEVFWHTKPDRQNETIVCADSRDPQSPGARDIIDKELAFLLWDALKDKELHCLVVMDCCHSGNNTRAAVADTGVRFRYIPSGKNKIPLEDYLGYKEGFYKVENGKANFAIARYVHLAAARDNEKAQESPEGGLFTSKLTEVLRSGGAAKTYRELVQSLTITIRNRASQQNPVAYARVDADLDLQFLGKSMKPYEPSYEIRYDSKRKKWIMYGGAIHNIVPSSAEAKTIVKIITGPAVKKDVTAVVIEVNATASVLAGEDLAVLDPVIASYLAIIVSMANPQIIIGPAPGLLSQPPLLQALKEAYTAQAHLFFAVDFEKNKETPGYEVQLTDDNAYILTKAGSGVPLFKRQATAPAFLKDVDAVCKWISVSELKNSNSKIVKDDFIFILEKIEGKGFNGENIEMLEGEKMEIIPGQELVFTYIENKQPAFRLSIGTRSTTTPLYAAALYMESKFGISDNLIENDNNRLVNGESPLQLSWTNDKGIVYKTMPLELDNRYKNYHINEITEFLKIFISTAPVNLERYKQENLKLDEPLLRPGTRGIAFDAGADAEGNAEEKSDWTVFTFPFRIVGPDKEKKLVAGKPADLASFTIHVPEGFSARAFAATGNDLQRKLNTVTRGVNPEDDALAPFISPPENIWGDIISSETPFSSGLSPASDNGIRVLELLPADNARGLKLEEGKEILISPKNGNTRAIRGDGMEETIVPYGYDEAAGWYYPLGYADDKGVIHISQLPEPTPGMIQGEEKLTRSIGSSVKLFFKKIFSRGNADTLTLYKLEIGKDWELITTDPVAMKTEFELEKNKGAAIVLLVHGILGSMKDITGSLRESKKIPGAARFVLAYDYENLSSPLSKIAKALKENLSQAGFGNGNGLSVSVIAHSMGGLIARRLVESEGADKYVKHLIFAGTPNAGSELAQLKSSLTGLITHAMNVTGPIKYALAGLIFLLKKMEMDPGETLSEMSPGSPFLTELLLSVTTPPVPYSMLGGNTSLLEKDYKGDDFYLKKVAEGLKRKILYPGLSWAIFKEKPNDMAVTLESMKKIPGFDAARMHVVINDHLSYFSEPLCQEKLIELL